MNTEASVAANLFDLSGRLALITGSTQGIGRSLAMGLARAGARVVLNGRDAARVEQAVGELSAQGFDARGVAFDVTQREAVQAGIARMARQ